MNDRAPGLVAAELVAELVRPEIRALSAYAVAKAEGMVKLDAMENPYPLPESAKSRLEATLSQVPINRYPDGGGDALRTALRRAFAIPGELGLILGNGSDELIQIITATLARPGAAMLAPEPSFVMYRMNALYSGMRYVGVSLKPDFELDTAAVLAAIERERPGLVYLAYPNNPTGNLFAGLSCLRRRELPVARSGVRQPSRAAHDVQGRHGGTAARVCGRGARMDRRIQQGAPAV